MRYIPLPERPDLAEKTEAAGFSFHTMYGQAYWNEKGAYAFTLEEIKTRIEDPATEMHAMVREATDRILRSEELMERCAIPEQHRDLVIASWQAREPELYGRFDFALDETGTARMLEYNADTPTSLFESAVFQWSWLEDMRERGVLPGDTDQFNGIFEGLRDRFAEMFPAGTDIHFSSLGSPEENVEDYGTVETMAYIARDAGMGAHFVELSQIGLTTERQFADGEDRVMGALFKLYPWEDMLRDDFAGHIAGSRCRMIEPAWKAVVSNKAILPVLWEMFEGHPNLLPSFFLEDMLAETDAVRRAVEKNLFRHGSVKKPIFSREGASVTITGPDDRIIEAATNRGYDRHPTIVQAYQPLPVFEGRRPILGVWMAGETACGMGIRDDESRITQDLSCFRPHIIDA